MLFGFLRYTANFTFLASFVNRWRLATFYSLSMPLSKPEITQLVDRARANDRGAWELLFRRFQLPLLAYCNEMLFNREDALDAVQQCFIKVIKHLPSLREDRKFAGWLFRIARQECIDSIRRKGRQEKLRQPLESDDFSSAMCPGDNTERADDIQLAITFVRGLDADLREPMVLYYLEDFALEQIAEVMQLPRGTVKSRLHRARQILKQKMEEAYEPA